MSKGKQSTLFHSWTTKGKGKERAVENKSHKKKGEIIYLDDEGTDQVQNNDIVPKYLEDPGIELGEELDDFFMDDIADEVITLSNETPAETTSCVSNRDIHNSSVYEEIPGFDVEAGMKYIYPTNYPIRDYQFNIVKKALFRNTLVSLPTGLGKTFIAAVVMYNFYRWYPHKKVVFLAPTKPLVAQQIEACFGIMGKFILSVL